MSSPKPYACWITIEVPLSGGRITAGVVRVDNEVRRPVGPNSDFVHAVLAAFADAGISGAPRYLGLDERGRERLSYLPGWVPPDLAHGEWSDEQLIAAGELIRRLHDALAGTALADGEETVCHNDLGPCNAVHVEGLPVAFIDWDAASPGSRVLDLGHAIWRWAIVSDTHRPPRHVRTRSQLRPPILYSNCCSSVEPVIAAVATSPPEIAWATSSK